MEDQHDIGVDAAVGPLTIVLALSLMSEGAEWRALFGGILPLGRMLWKWWGKRLNGRRRALLGVLNIAFYHVTHDTWSRSREKLIMVMRRMGEYKSMKRQEEYRMLGRDCTWLEDNGYISGVWEPYIPRNPHAKVQRAWCSEEAIMLGAKGLAEFDWKSKDVVLRDRIIDVLSSMDVPLVDLDQMYGIEYDD